ncbi:MAG: alpha/beta hydrolase, partial [Pseudomonadota bacterium]
MKRFARFLVVAIAGALGLGWAYAAYSLATEEHAYAPVTVEQREQAEAYLAKAIEPILDGWVWSEFEPEDGVSLRVGTFEPSPPDPLGVIVVVPGYTAPLEMLAYSINRFHEAGYIVRGVEYRGQGLSSRLLENPEKGHVEDYAMLAADLGKFADSVRQPDMPLHIYAISQGAHITMRMAGDGLGQADTYALIVPMAKIFT